jgi:hypothetical protein
MKEFTPGEIVNIKNDQGAVEGGWQIFLVKAEQQQVIVVKEQGSGPVSKTVSFAELASLNP